MVTPVRRNCTSHSTKPSLLVLKKKLKIFDYGKKKKEKSLFTVVITIKILLDFIYRSEDDDFSPFLSIKLVCIHEAFSTKLSTQSSDSPFILD